MAIISNIEMGTFMRLFNRAGYVLNFSTNDFDIFTMDSVGVALCEKYNMSKGKSLTAFLNQAAESDCVKLISDLFDYYENNFEDEYTQKEEEDDRGYSRYNADYGKLYKKCKVVINRINNNISPLSPTVAELKEKFSSKYLSKQIDLMLAMQSENPTEAIGKAKELIESCCKTILDNTGITWDKNWDVGKLAGETLNHLSLLPASIHPNDPGANLIKAILGNLRSIATKLAELRNPYGSGHGKSATFTGLEERHAKLAVGSSITFVNFLWDTYSKEF